MYTLLQVFCAIVQAFHLYRIHNAIYFILLLYLITNPKPLKLEHMYTVHIT